MLKEKMQSLISKDKGNSKKKIESLVVFIVILIITIIAINSIWNNKKETKSSNDTTSVYKQLAENSNNTMTDEDMLQKKLEEILSKIDGVGNVKVLITYSQSKEIVPMYNENSKVTSTEETDSQGGIRKVEENDIQKEVIYSNKSEPVTQKVLTPRIEGAIITAVGGNNAMTKTNIIQAVEAVTGLATHKIQVFEMKV